MLLQPRPAGTSDNNVFRDKHGTPGQHRRWISDGPQESGKAVNGNQTPAMAYEPFRKCPQRSKKQGGPVETGLHATLRPGGMDHQSGRHDVWWEKVNIGNLSSRHRHSLTDGTYTRVSGSPLPLSQRKPPPGRHRYTLALLLPSHHFKEIPNERSAPVPEMQLRIHV